MRAWLFLTAWPRGFVSWLHEALCALTTDEGRKGWAMLAALGCCVVMTLYAVAVLYLVRGVAWMAFWLGLAALGTNLVVVTGLMVLLGVHRNLSAKRGDTEVSIEDK